MTSNVLQRVGFALAPHQAYPSRRPNPSCLRRSGAGADPDQPVGGVLPRMAKMTMAAAACSKNKCRSDAAARPQFAAVRSWTSRSTAAPHADSKSTVNGHGRKNTAAAHNCEKPKNHLEYQWVDRPRQPEKRYLLWTAVARTWLLKALKRSMALLSPNMYRDSMGVVRYPGISWTAMLPQSGYPPMTASIR